MRCLKWVCLLMTLQSGCFSFTLFTAKSYSHNHQSSIVHPLAARSQYVPYFPWKGSKDYMWMDIYNTLGRQRSLFVSGYLDDEACNQLISSLIWLHGWVSFEDHYWPCRVLTCDAVAVVCVRLRDDQKAPITMYFNVAGAKLKPSDLAQVSGIDDICNFLLCWIVGRFGCFWRHVTHQLSPRHCQHRWASA